MSEESPRRETPPDAPGAESGSETSSSGSADAGHGAGVPLEAISTREILIWMLGVLGAKAWQGMGLVPNPASGKIEKDLGDAKIAIDAFSAVLDALRPVLEAQALRETEAMLTTLRLNFVEKSSNS